MAINAKLELRHSQQLVMTPQLQQAIKLLQLSNLELAEFVEIELERNPLLERDESAERPLSAERPDGEAALVKSEGDPSASDEWVDTGRGTSEAANALDTDYENIYPDTSPSELASAGGLDGAMLAGSSWANVKGIGSGGLGSEDNDLESYVASSLSLHDHLSAQLPLTLSDPAERLIGVHLIDLVDDAGYLHADLDELSDKLGAPREMIERVLSALQTLDPPGIFARSLAECLALQLKDCNRYDPQIAALLDNLDLLARHDVAKLRKAVGVDLDELSDMINEIKGLNPKPGLAFGSVQVQPVVPDVIVRTASDNSWIVELNSDTLPRVLVDRSYFVRVSRTANSESDKEYLSECLQTANWLVKSLDQRARTILKVSQEIVRQQDGFFTYGIQHLRPLNLKTVADAISMHESTVSRVTSNKYMATSRGIFELKYFFTSAIQSASDGEAHSSESVRYRIKQLIDGEMADQVLSDDQIVDLLRRDGIDIARRTVAKYREAMRVPSSVQRRRQKRALEQVARA
ncbi:MAG: RNA polymerase sigma-54 factor [Alphaproteobacteria bacterium BRH_c36]|nr:MAG: RNA polymerase sigma-54 factor [Alphaproteobacteria bacterium BRH_c36]